MLPLFGRVEPIAGESLLSLIARTAQVNVHDRLAAMLDEVDLGRARTANIPFSRVDHAYRLARLLSVEVDEIASRMHPRIGGESPHYIDWYGTPLERRFIKTTMRRFAPKGLRTSPHHRAVWGHITPYLLPRKL